MKRYLAFFGSNHFDFRLPELEAVAKLFNINLTYDKIVNVANVSLYLLFVFLLQFFKLICQTPFVEVFVDSEEDLIKIASRAVTVK
jgi:tRNA G10  N-methylase Trm11